MLASLIASALVNRALAQDQQTAGFDNPAAAVDGTFNPSANALPVQPGWAPYALNAPLPPPPPILASDYIQSGGQLPTWNPGYLSNSQGYFVPVWLDVDEELPTDLTDNLVDPAVIEELQSAAEANAAAAAAAAANGGAYAWAGWNQAYAPSQ